MAGEDIVARGRRVGRAVAWRLVHRMWRGAERVGEITADTPAGRAFASFGPESKIGFPTGALYGLSLIHISEPTRPY